MAASAGVDFPDGAGGANLDVSWIHGSEAAKYNTDPDIQVHACDEHTYILRQNMAVHYEAPFMFLLFGASRALLLDTGATANPQFFPLRRTVDSIIDGITKSLKKGDQVSFVGFGTFKISNRKARIARNPQTGVAIKIPKRRVPRFSAGKVLRQAVK